MIYTSYFGNLKNLNDNYIPISICGKAPYWFYQGRKYKNLAPKYKFFMEWKENKDNDFYIQHFKEEILDTLNINKVLYDLYCSIPDVKRLILDLECDEDGNQINWYESKIIHIVLICYEKPEDFCHRHLVADWFNENGIKCEELTDEHL